MCFGNFAGLGHRLHNIALAVSSSFYQPLWERFWHQSDVRGWCHVVFWPRDSKTIFGGKLARLWGLVESLLLTPDVSNFGIACLAGWILRLNKNKFHFIGTLSEWASENIYMYMPLPKLNRLRLFWINDHSKVWNAFWNGEVEVSQVSLVAQFAG